MIEIAQGKAEVSDVKNLTFERSTIDELSVPDQSFDAVLALSILHLVDSKEDVVAEVHRMLKPGGIFVSSTVCLGDNMKFLKVIAPIGRLLGLMPSVEFFTTEGLRESLTVAGFGIDYQWQPGKSKGVFIVAKKPGS